MGNHIGVISILFCFADPMAGNKTLKDDCWEQMKRSRKEKAGVCTRAAKEGVAPHYLLLAT